MYAPEICKSRKASAFSGQWPLSQGFRCCHSVQNGLYAGISVSHAPIHRMSSKYANLEWLAPLSQHLGREAVETRIPERHASSCPRHLPKACTQCSHSKYANLEWLALFLANGHCHSTWGEKRLKHEFQSGMLPAVHGICPKHAHNVPKLRRDFVLIFVLRIVATVTATRNDPIPACVRSGTKDT